MNAVRTAEEGRKNTHRMAAVLWKMLVCSVLLCAVWGGYIAVKVYVTDRKIEIKEDDFSWVYQVDTAETEGKNLVLRGFAFVLDADAVEGAFELVLQDGTSGKRYFLNMEYTLREDVNEYFFCEYDYRNSGFQATIDTKKLDLAEKDYEVLLRVAGKQRAYHTGTYLSKGKLMYTNPAEFEPLEVAGTALEEVVECGVLRVYRPDVGMYVYQYDGELYWIAEPEYGFVDENTNVQYHLETTQKENLPKKRLENQWYWDNIGFQFTTNEMTGLNFGIYRVAKKALPVEYAIAKIRTGNYINGWIWMQDFRPWYVLE